MLYVLIVFGGGRGREVRAVLGLLRGVGGGLRGGSMITVIMDMLLVVWLLWLVVLSLSSLLLLWLVVVLFIIIISSSAIIIIIIIIIMVTVLSIHWLSMTVDYSIFVVTATTTTTTTTTTTITTTTTTTTTTSWLHATTTAIVYITSVSCGGLLFAHGGEYTINQHIQIIIIYMIATSYILCINAISVLHVTIYYLCIKLFVYL